MKGTDLTDSQSLFAQTMYTCATSLAETVANVLEFSKLRGNATKGGAEHSGQLVE